MSVILTIFKKELKTEFRNWQMITASLLMSIMVIATFRFTFMESGYDFTEVAAPIIWISFFFGGMFALAPVYKKEIEQGTMDGLLMAPVDPSAIFYGKFLATLVIILGMEVFSLVLFFVFFGVDPPDMLALAAIILLGTIGFVSLGNIISAISANLSKTEILLVVCLTPLLLFSIVMSVTSATGRIFTEGAGIGDIYREIIFILLFDIVYLIAGYLFIRFILED